MKTFSNPAIHFHNITLKIDNRTIINNVTGSFPEGKITTLVGPSGAGKSTILKLCNRLISQSSGELYIAGQAIEHYNPIDLRRKVGIVLQSAPMIKGTVFDNLNLPRVLQNSSLSTEEAVSILADVGLDDTFLQKDASSLSGGQKQRVSIARTLVNDAQILLLDEITSALDHNAVKEIENLILHINNKHGVTIIWITHNLQQATHVGHYMWVLMDGELIEAGNSNLLLHSKNKKVQLFMNGGV
ncbi:ABC transporter ATP-binding protein [Kurthia sibirica]|uniref:Phosphate ABC transporter ATP-binding protein n=1 Tax=Kurthia sibirica TaxID=202750 RepID=A0A2U3AJ59_9BACL|nr:phosphate ABC transporter ATP-binding protein [Kurthia sibirica]PWI24580.1 phosphate ABC transporter ATP-binding protein [Kurthia sibirica]GEK33533.1 putative ABC transporter ATP-binding protein YjkB [Kurthia sibirica]